MNTVLSGATPASAPWYSEPCVLIVGTVPPYTGFCFNACTVPWRMTPILHVLPLMWHTVSSLYHFGALPGWQLRDEFYAMIE